MPIPKASFAREQMDDPRLGRMQEELISLRTIVAACPFIKGTPVTVTLTVGDNRVIHRLGRAPSGPPFVLTAAHNKAPIHTDIFPSTTPASDPTNAMNLTATVAADVTLWFF
jgi:hypothetical protein